jgi:hypothetical protein
MQLALASVAPSGAASHRSLQRLAGVVALALGAIVGLFLLVGVAYSYRAPTVYNKDFLQDYLVARAAADGVDPYQPLAELARRYVPQALPVVVHPTPHPPPLVVLLRPLAQLPFETAALVWLALQLGCLVLTIVILGRLVDVPLGPVPLFAAVALAALWYPVFEELSTAQVTLPILALAAGGQLALARRQTVVAGALFGLALLLMPVIWLVLPYLLLRRARRAALALGCTVAAGYSIAVATLGLTPLTDYLTRVGPQVAAIYRATSRNLALWSLGWRVFAGTPGTATGRPIPASVEAPALVPWPAAAPVAAGLLLLLALALVAWLLHREHDKLSGLGIAIAASLWLGPTTWDFSLVLLAVPLSTIAVRRAAQRFPWRATALSFSLIALTAIPEVVFVDLARAIGSTSPGGALTVAGPALLTLLPSIAIPGIAALVAAGHLTPDPLLLGEEGLGVRCPYMIETSTD